MYKIFAAVVALSLTLPASAVSLAQENAANEVVAQKFNIKALTLDSKSSPYALVQSLGEQIFASVSAAKAQANGDKQVMRLIVERQLMPYIDVKFASYKILGPQLKKSKKSERELFVDAMQSNLIDTYSSALAQYNNQTINYEPAKDFGNKKTVAVKTELISPDQPPVNMTFKLRKNKKTGEWKAYDLVVEGISLVDAKRAELSKPLRANGIEYVATNLLN